VLSRAWIWSCETLFCTVECTIYRVELEIVNVIERLLEIALRKMTQREL
jgi:hypothetical protein